MDMVPYNAIKYGGCIYQAVVLDVDFKLDDNLPFYSWVVTLDYWSMFRIILFVGDYNKCWFTIVVEEGDLPGPGDRAYTGCIVNYFHR